jgi:hypothetical protein
MAWSDDCRLSSARSSPSTREPDELFSSRPDRNDHGGVTFINFDMSSNTREEVTLEDLSDTPHISVMTLDSPSQSTYYERGLGLSLCANKGLPSRPKQYNVGQHSVQSSCAGASRRLLTFSNCQPISPGAVKAKLLSVARRRGY